MPTFSRDYLSSYIFWMNKQDTWIANKAPGYKFPGSYDSYIHAVKECPFADGFPYFQHEGHEYYCLCSLLKKMNDYLAMQDEYGSAWSKASLDDLVPLRPKEALFKEGAATLVEAKKYISGWMENPSMSWITILGNPGNGKTTILRSIKTKFPGISLYLSYGKLQGTLFNLLNDRGDAMETYIRRISNVPILLLDDYGAATPSNYVANMLFGVVNARYENPKKFPLVITTNENIADSLNGIDKAVARTASRFTDHQIVKGFNFTQPDYRSRKNVNG